jgi:hypothetical protein
MYSYWTFKPLQAPLTEGNLILLAPNFFLVIHVHKVIFSYTVYLTGIIDFNLLSILLDKGVSIFRLT